MKNTLKYVLIILGVLLSGYGFYILFNPEISLQTGPIDVEAQENNSQAYAMVALGILSLFAGLTFNKR